MNGTYDPARIQAHRNAIRGRPRGRGRNQRQNNRAMENPVEQQPADQPQQPAEQQQQPINNDEADADEINSDPGEETQSNASTDDGVPDDALPQAHPAREAVNPKMELRS